MQSLKYLCSRRYDSEMKLDVLTSLPPELMLKVLGYLRAKDISRCLSVSKRWYVLIGNFDPIWRRIYIREFGLSSAILQDLIPRFSSAKDLYLIVRSNNLPTAMSMIGHALLCKEYHGSHCEHSKETVTSLIQKKLINT